MIVDDHPLLHQGIVATLAPYDHISVVGSALNGEEFLSSVEKLNPDVVLMDMRMPKLSGIETVKRLLQVCPDARVICLTGYEDEIDLMEMLRVGAKGFMLKSSEPTELISAIEKVTAGELFYCKNAVNIMIRSFLKDTPSLEEAIAYQDFTKKEVEIIKLICLQKTSKEISDQVFLGQKTIEYYRQRILEKMHVRNTAGIVIFAIKNHIVNINYL